jgi:hypothetical protein
MVSIAYLATKKSAGALASFGRPRRLAVVDDAAACSEHGQEDSYEFGTGYIAPVVLAGMAMPGGWSVALAFCRS